MRVKKETNRFFFLASRRETQVEESRKSDEWLLRESRPARDDGGTHLTTGSPLFRPLPSLHFKCQLYSGSFPSPGRRLIHILIKSNLAINECVLFPLKVKKEWSTCSLALVMLFAISRSNRRRGVNFLEGGERSRCLGTECGRRSSANEIY